MWCMCMCVCVVCVCVCVHVCVHACVCVHVCVHACVCVRVLCGWSDSVVCGWVGVGVELHCFVRGRSHRFAVPLALAVHCCCVEGGL